MIAYYRVSTSKQGERGLGMQAQQEAVANYCRSAGRAVIQGYTEVESGKRNKRPELAKAMAHAKRLGCTLIVAKLDRLARNARFLLSIVESGVDIVFCDLPTIPTGPVGKFMITQMAAVAELEAGLISQRTKAALAALKANGVKLGSAREGHWDGQCANKGVSRDQARKDGLATARETIAKSRREVAAITYGDFLPEMKRQRSEGLSLQKIADALNEAGRFTVNGKTWNPIQVSRVLEKA